MMQQMNAEGILSVDRLEEQRQRRARGERGVRIEDYDAGGRLGGLLGACGWVQVLPEAVEMLLPAHHCAPSTGPCDRATGSQHLHAPLSLHSADAAVQQGARANAAAAESDEDVGLEVRPLLVLLLRCHAKTRMLLMLQASSKLFDSQSTHCLRACLLADPATRLAAGCACACLWFEPSPALVLLTALQALVEEQMAALVEAEEDGNGDAPTASRGGTGGGGGGRGGGDGEEEGSELAPGALLAREAATVPLNDAQRREAEVLRAAGITGGRRCASS